jgi:hypothetical protein
MTRMSTVGHKRTLAFRANAVFTDLRRMHGEAKVRVRVCRQRTWLTLFTAELLLWLTIYIYTNRPICWLILVVHVIQIERAHIRDL